MREAAKDLEMQHNRAIEILKRKGHTITVVDTSNVIVGRSEHDRTEHKVLELHRLASEWYPDEWHESERLYEESVRGKKT